MISAPLDLTRNLLEFRYQLLKVRVVAQRFESAVSLRPVTDGAETAVIRASQQDHRRWLLAEQRISAGAVINRHSIVRFQLQHSSQRGIRLFACRQNVRKLPPDGSSR